jgi:hypothetical protein
MRPNLNNRLKWLVGAMLPLLLLACLIGERQGTALPPGRPADFEVQTATPTASLTQVSSAAPTSEAGARVILPIEDAPTHTPDPNAPPTIPPLLVDTPVPVALEPEAQLLTPTTELTATTPTSAPPRPTVKPDPPLRGGDWSFETDFIRWPNPYGEPCPGAAVASGWTAFVEDGQYGSSCMNENLYAPNVRSGAKSQEITFDFISANSGIFRAIPTQVGHRYTITAYAKHDHSISPVEMALGIDLTGGTAWTGETVQWFAWDESAEDTWAATEETVTATNEVMTIFIKGYHPMADQGGKTVIDDVSVVDQGM